MLFSAKYLYVAFRCYIRAAEEAPRQQKLSKTQPVKSPTDRESGPTRGANKVRECFKCKEQQLQETEGNQDQSVPRKKSQKLQMDARETGTRKGIRECYITYITQINTENDNKFKMTKILPAKNHHTQRGSQHVRFVIV